MSKRKGGERSDDAGDGGQKNPGEDVVKSSETSTEDVKTSENLSGPCDPVKCPDESIYLQCEGKPLDGLSREELERRLAMAESCVCQTREALVKAQAAVETQSKEAERTLTEMKDALARALADFDNYRKRVEREREGWLRDGRSEGVLAALDTLDNLDRAIQSLEGSEKEGLSKIRSSMFASLSSIGLEEMDPVGRAFDPNLHEAVLTGVAEGVADDIVIEVLAKGYSLGGKLLRPAKVKVSKSR